MRAAAILARWGLVLVLSATSLACGRGRISGSATADAGAQSDAGAQPDATLPDSQASCGDGIVAAGETCDTGVAAGDPGECPTTCDDTQVCTTDSLLNAGTCTATCVFVAITTPIDNDGCCPSGADANNDSDCSATCGNGAVESGETCDTAIASGDPGECPTSCTDGDSCTTDTLLSGGTCNAVCSFTDIALPNDNDGCCPSGANANNDNDCSPICGNMVVEAGERCDTGIPSGAGSCPTACDDSMSCTIDSLQNAATCAAECIFTDITNPINGDGCCPSGANANTDNDCSPVCGNMVVEAGETCDTSIPSGAGSCPTICDDALACTVDALVNGGTCTATCTNTPITMAVNSDGCCPSGANANTDNDCSPVCGNNVVESGEACDDGGTVNGDGCDDMCQVEETAFRVREMFLRDPHVFVKPFFFTPCGDETNTLNSDTNGVLQGDAEPDGLLDLNILLVFKPLAQSSASTDMDVVVDADCTAPISSTACAMTGTSQVYPTTAANDPANPCLDTILGTTRPYSPAVGTPTLACFVTQPSINFNLVIFGVTIPFSEAQFAATYNADPATMVTTGLFRAFLSEADANNITINLPIVGNKQMSELLPGGAGNCNGGDDRDNGSTGWYFYMNFTADRVPWTP